LLFDRSTFPELRLCVKHDFGNRDFAGRMPVLIGRARNFCLRDPKIQVGLGSRGTPVTLTKSLDLHRSTLGRTPDPRTSIPFPPAAAPIPCLLPNQQCRSNAFCVVRISLLPGYAIFVCFSIFMMNKDV